jgi:hypothetical protein
MLWDIGKIVNGSIFPVNFTHLRLRFQAHLRIVNDQASIHALQEHTNIPEAAIKPLKANREGTNEVWWHWHTVRTDIDGTDIDGGIKELLKKYRPFFTVIKKYRGPEAATCLELVTYHQEHEEPRGLYLSSETVTLLSELGAAFDNDCVYDVTNIPPKDVGAKDVGGQT